MCGCRWRMSCMCFELQMPARRVFHAGMYNQLVRDGTYIFHDIKLIYISDRCCWSTISFFPLLYAASAKEAVALCLLAPTIVSARRVAAQCQHVHGHVSAQWATVTLRIIFWWSWDPNGIGVSGHIQALLISISYEELKEDCRLF